MTPEPVPGAASTDGRRSPVMDDVQPSSALSDRPFPGARSQVRGQGRQEPGLAPRALRRDEPTSRDHGADARSLDLEATPVASERGWSVRLPVRADQVSVEKEVVAYERVTVRRRDIQDQAHLQANVRREEARISSEGISI